MRRRNVPFLSMAEAKSKFEKQAESFVDAMNSNEPGHIVCEVRYFTDSPEFRYTNKFFAGPNVQKAEREQREATNALSATLNLIYELEWCDIEQYRDKEKFEVFTKIPLLRRTFLLI